MTLTVVALTEDRFDDFIALVQALALYERLEPPSAAAIARLHADAFGVTPRYQAFLGCRDGEAIGYAITFETYSSFLAKPTQYLEDLFVREDARNLGMGGLLFDYVLALASSKGCGRMEWQVLDWNALARDFYAHRSATSMSDWLTYRIVL